MDIRKITDDFSVAPQIRVADVAAIAAAGFRAVICNRPDGEVADQPRSDDVAAAVTASGMEWRMMPVVQVSRHRKIAAFHRAVPDVMVFAARTHVTAPSFLEEGDELATEAHQGRGIGPTGCGV